MYNNVLCLSLYDIFLNISQLYFESSFDFCTVDDGQSPVENLGQVVFGERIRPSPYKVSPTRSQSLWPESEDLCIFSWNSWKIANARGLARRYTREVTRARRINWNYWGKGWQLIINIIGSSVEYREAFAKWSKYPLEKQFIDDMICIYQITCQ